MMVLLFTTSVYAKEVNIIKDNNLKKAILNMKDEWGTVDTNGDGIITATEAHDFSGTLFLPFNNIKSIEGIEYFDNVTDVDLAKNNISDITPLFGMDKLQYVALSANKINNTLLRKHSYDSEINKLRAKGVTVATGNQKVNWDESKITENTPKYRVLFVIVKDIHLTVPLANGKKSHVDYTLTNTDINILKEFARLYERYTEKLSNYAVDIVVDVYVTNKTVKNIGEPGWSNDMYQYALWGSDISEISNILYDYDTTIVNAYLNSDMHDYSGLASFNGTTKRGEVFVPYNQLIYPCKVNNIPLKNWLSELKNDALDGVEVDTYVHEFIHTLEQYGTFIGKNIWEFHDAIYQHEFKEIDTDFEDMFDRMGSYLRGYSHPDDKSQTGITKDIYINSPTKKYSTLKAPKTPKISAKVNEKNTQIKLNWDLNNDATYYRIYRSTSSNKGYKLIGKTTNNSYKDTNIDANITYYYKVEAVLSKNKQVAYSKFSNVAKIKTTLKAPKLTVSLKNYNTLQLKIGSVSGATKYKIYRSTSKNGKYTKIGELKKEGTFIDKKLVIGKTYYYKVRAYNKNGDSGAYSSVESKKTIPSTPSLALKTTNKKISITLNKVNEADGYEIYRSNSKNGKYTKITTTKKLKYDNKTKKGKKYYYKARSYTLYGKTKVYSNYSKIMCIKSK